MEACFRIIGQVGVNSTRHPLKQLCPTQTAYWDKKYVTILTRATHRMTYCCGPHIKWLILILINQI